MNNELDIVDSLLKAEKDVPKKESVKRFQQFQGLKYVSTDEFEKLGKPLFGYTTARISQFEHQSKEWQKVFCEYLISAIKFVKLNWYLSAFDWEGTIDKKIKDAGLEIKEFCKRENLTSHDFRWVEQICYENDYSRPALITLLKRYDEKAITPKKERPPFIHLKWAAPPIEIEMVEEEPSLQDVVDELFHEKEPKVVTKVKGGCLTHSEYRGLRKPRNSCKECETFYLNNKKAGIKESRNV